MSVKKINTIIAGCFLFCTLWTSCKDDFSVNAEYEDFPIVYALLDIDDDVHYVKVFKSFLTSGSAYDVVKDIRYYSYIDSVEVYLLEYDANKNFRRRIDLDTTTAIAKDSGLFAYPTQVLYATTAALSANYYYDLCVFNPYTNKIANLKAIIPMTEQARITKPMGTDLAINPARDFLVEFYTGNHNRKCTVMLNFHYTERMYDGTEQQNVVACRIGEFDNPSSNGNIKGTAQIAGRYFFQTVGSSIPDNADVRLRYVDSLVLTVHSSEKEWALYQLANVPSSSLSQERMEYTNIVAKDRKTDKTIPAFGVCSSKASANRMYQHLNLLNGRDSLFYGVYTKHLKFTDLH
jgi:hypothetical protein